MTSLRSRIVYQFYQTFGSPFDARASLEQQRADMEGQGQRARMPPRVEVESVTVGSMYAEWLRPREAEPESAILYLHGGGYTMGSCDTHRALAARIAAAGKASALMINYRLAPENPFPAALEDVTKAYASLLSDGRLAARTVVIGDSAGGGLAIALAVGLRDLGKPLPAGIVGISPWLDLSMSGETMKTCARSDPLISWESSVLQARRYVGKHDPREPLISPLFADVHGLSPLLLQVGEHEVLRSNSVRMAERARAAGVDARLEVWPGMWHVWHAWGSFVPEARRAIKRIGNFVQERLAT